MQKLVIETFYPVPPETLFEMHSRPEALRRLSPSVPPLKRVTQDGGFESGTTVRIELGAGPFTMSWLAGLVDVVPGKRFVDVQLEGPFRTWRHEHLFCRAERGCVMRDEVHWDSGVFLNALVRPSLVHYFKKRHVALGRWVADEQKPQQNQTNMEGS